MEITKELEERIMLDDDAVTKLFLFKEFAKLEEMREVLENRKKDLDLREKELERKEREVSQGTKALKDQELFFEKKMQILKDGYLGLDEDRRRLEIERAEFEVEKKKAENTGHARSDSYRHAFYESDFVKSNGFFAGVNSLLALKKRYKDLLKIYHPDNYTGDSDTLVAIKEEYESLLSYYEERIV